MRLLDLYVGRIFIFYLLIVLLVPGLLFSIFDLLSQLDQVGRGAFTTADALAVVILSAPERFIQLIPVCTFLAALAALGRLSDRGELIAMEAAGRSVLGVSTGIIAACLLVAICSFLAGEFIVPSLDERAEALRLKARANRNVTYTKGGFWAKRGNTFIHVGSMVGNSTAKGISIFQFDSNGSLTTYTAALSAVIENDYWLLQDVTVRRINGLETAIYQLPFYRVPTFLNAKDMKALELSPESLSTIDLWAYIKALKKGGQNPDHFVLALWRKITRPLFSLSMALLAAGFCFQTTGRGQMGARVTIGIVAGLVFYFLDQITMQIGLLWGINPVLTAFIPVILAGAGAAVQVRRVL